MLTPETKRKIDNCRDTLVGKIPVPMSQIEQITLALTYKFMSDIDEENRELGWASFFEWDFEKYAWKNIMDKRNGAQERLNLYSEGLDSMSRNGNIPDLFRDIFRNAYLPFKDPTTLDRFLKQIDEFHYEHSEELGNAFEYLLSTAGSQGDAGQFRTPRHIIDFLVSVVEPTKDDTILDPACGTAGFLISAYKYILEQNGKNLSIEDKQKISKNISGYDISHDMVRLSLVNMYLHNFADPKIYEYDTLSSEERWHDDFDCILANPPFMTPKGGSQPHKRFSITSTKSEVLFVDYIMEHMKIHGKAGIIVPEGVIFQSGKAYKELRENMVKNNFLWAVVSLPGGVFQPYSGVKTSILFFDRQLAKKTDKILFVKVSNDGYDLGAQRRETWKNDLPEAFGILKKYKENIEKNVQEEFISGSFVNIIEKTSIAESGDYNLSGDRYKTTGTAKNLKWWMVKIWDICEVWDGNHSSNYPKAEEMVDAGIIFIRSVNIQNDILCANDIKYITAEKHAQLRKGWLQTNDILFTNRGEIWKVALVTREFNNANLNSQIAWLRPNITLMPRFLWHILRSPIIQGVVQDWQAWATLKQFTIKQLKDLQIPLPSLEFQEQIVAELDGYQRIIDGARAVVENYKPIIKIDPEWEIKELGEICDVRDWTHDSPKQILEWYPLITSKNLKDGELDFSNVGYISEEDFKKVSQRSYVDEGDIIMPMIGTIWGACLIKKKEQEFAIKNVALFKKSKFIIPGFLLNILKSEMVRQMFDNQSAWATQKFVSLGVLRGLKIPVPPLEIQEQIVARIETEENLINTTKELISLFEGKVKVRIGEVWWE
jgi:type I restriction enzyme M protein